MSDVVSTSSELRLENSFASTQDKFASNFSEQETASEVTCIIFQHVEGFCMECMAKERMR